MNSELVTLLKQRGLNVNEATTKNELESLFVKSFRLYKWDDTFTYTLYKLDGIYEATYLGSGGSPNISSIDGSGDTAEDAIGAMILRMLHYEKSDLLHNRNRLRTDNDPDMRNKEWAYFKKRHNIVIRQINDNQKEKETQWKSGVRNVSEVKIEITRDFNPDGIEQKQEPHWVCLHCGWRGTETERIKTYTDETVMGQGALKAKNGCHFYEMGFRAGWDCSPLVQDIGQPVKRIVCDNAMYNLRADYYEKHPDLEYATDDEIKEWSEKPTDFYGYRFWEKKHLDLETNPAPAWTKVFPYLEHKS